MAFSDYIYQKIRGEIQPLKIGISPVEQLADRISKKISSKSEIKIAGFVCPFYEIDESKLDKGFGLAISGIGRGELNKFPRYQKKVDKFLHLVTILESLFKGRVDLSLDILMGDTGIINARSLVNSNTNQAIEDNMESYKKYMSKNFTNLKNIKTNIFRFSDRTGIYSGLCKPLSDLDEDGRKLHDKMISFDINEDVLKKVRNEQVVAAGKGSSVYESVGFMLNYGLAGMVLRNNDVDILIGTDPAGSYMNYLYHAFIKPEELFVVVPK